MHIGEQRERRVCIRGVFHPVFFLVLFVYFNYCDNNDDENNNNVLFRFQILSYRMGQDKNKNKNENDNDNIAVNCDL